MLKGVNGDVKTDENSSQSRVPEEDLTSFSLWVKNELQPYVDKVVVSSRSMMGPALVISPISSAMRQMAFMKNLIEEQAKVFFNLFRKESLVLSSKTSHLSLTKQTT